MRYVTINGKPVASSPAREVVSRSAILILSGVLIGNTVAQGPLTGVAFGGFCAGIVGMISFLALDLAARRRQNRIVRRTLAAADSTLAKRLRRHVACQSPNSPRRRTSLVTMESSYLPVTVGGPAWQGWDRR
jgi:hypothetical protein